MGQWDKEVGQWERKWERRTSGTCVISSRDSGTSGTSGTKSCDSETNGQWDKDVGEWDKWY